MFHAIITFLITFLIALVITHYLNIFFKTDYSSVEERQEVVYKVTAELGIVGCLSREKFKEASEDYAKKDFTAVQKMLDEEACFFFAKGEELKALSGTCSTNDGDNDLFPFKTAKMKFLQPYLPCFAVR